MPNDLDQLKEYLVVLKAEHDASKEKERREAWTKGAGVSVVFIAVLAAVATQWGGKYSGRTLTALNDATYFQARASDQWSYFQAKSIKQNLCEMAREQEQGHPTDKTAAIAADLDAKVTKFAEEKTAIKGAAEKLEAQRQQAREAAGAWSVRGAGMGLSVAIYQIAIAVASIALLMKKKPFWYASLAMAAAATAQLVHIFMT
jgi:plasmid stability protein